VIRIKVALSLSTTQRAMYQNQPPYVTVIITRLAFKKASSDSLRNFYQGVCLNVKMTVLLAEGTSANIKIQVTSKVMVASSLSFTKRNMSIYMKMHVNR
jgi:hypothetical protein